MTQPSRIDGLPDLPKLPDEVAIADGTFNSNAPLGSPLYTADQMNAHYLKGFEAGSAAAAQAAKQVPGDWRPIETAPEGVRVLLGPRDAPVVGMVSHPVEWQEGEMMCVVVHYNGTVLVAGYHCKEWHPLPATSSATSLAEAAVRPPMCRIAGVSEGVLRRAAIANGRGVEAAEAGQVEALLQELETCYRDGSPSGSDVLLSEALYKRIRVALAATPTSPQAPAPQAGATE